MSGDPSRRPSNDRVRMDIDLNATVWVECSHCLGDGWHYPMVGIAGDFLRKSRKITCGMCGGKGAVQVPALQCGPGARIVAGPKSGGNPRGP